MKETLSERRMIDCLSDDYGIEVAALKFLNSGADTNAAVYKAIARDQSSYFVKLKQNHHPDIAITILSLLHDAGIQQVIFPVKTIQGRPTRHIGDFTLIVYPFIEGEDAFSRSLTEEQWITLGKVMRKIHGFKVPLSVQDQIRKETYASKWREIVRSLYNLESSGDETALRLSMFMKKKSAEIHRLVDRAEQLAKKSREQASENVLCHSDIHGGNVLIDRNGNIYIIDWDEPIMAPKERDLMFIGGGVANVWNDPKEEECFYQGYGKTEVNRILLAYYRLERIVEDIAIYGQELLLTTAGGEQRSKMYKEFIDMFEPQGVVDIAFKTDESLST
jgi:spectinomycin phosphotransferase